MAPSEDPVRSLAYALNAYIVSQDAIVEAAREARPPEPPEQAETTAEPPQAG